MSKNEPDFFFSKWLQKTNVRKTKMRKMDIKVKVCKEKLLIDLIRITCVCAAGQKWSFFSCL